jgi:hypothetical protein
MKNPLPNLSKIPPRVIFAVIAASFLISYLSTLRPVSANLPDFGRMLRDGINGAYARSQRNTQYRGSVMKAIDKTYQQVTTSGCLQPVQVESTLPSGRLVEIAEEPQLTDPLAIALFKLAPGTPGREVLRRVGYPVTSSQKAMSDYYDTANGRIAVKYERRNKVSRVVSVQFVN